MKKTTRFRLVPRFEPGARSLRPCTLPATCTQSDIQAPTLSKHLHRHQRQPTDVDVDHNDASRRRPKTQRSTITGQYSCIRRSGRLARPHVTISGYLPA